MLRSTRCRHRSIAHTSNAAAALSTLGPRLSVGGRVAYITHSISIPFFAVAVAAAAARPAIGIARNITGEIPINIFRFEALDARFLSPTIITEHSANGWNSFSRLISLFFVCAQQKVTKGEQEHNENCQNEIIYLYISGTFYSLSPK